MTKIKESTTKKRAEFLASFAMMSCKIAANTKCMCIFHQLDKPSKLKKLRKY